MLFEPTFLAIQVLNGLQLASLLFLLSVGLTVVYGLMNFINLAHGTLYMLGAYLGLTLVGENPDHFGLPFIFAPLLVAGLGAVAQVTVLRWAGNTDPMRQVLVTFGLVFVGLDVVRYIWGDYSHSIPAPRYFLELCQSSGSYIPVTAFFL
ncbi:MAG: hypothetical protein CM1200mP4_5250 [Rhodospirillaceae bacterium]|nr:MAG: hypothetical protein CM1200mP4_5250 [Rhodospirillaceae bacterium]